MNFEWIDSSLLLDFQAEGTDAHRLCTCQDGWIERFGRDVLISFKSVLARERLLEDMQSWASSAGIELRRRRRDRGHGVHAITPLAERYPSSRDGVFDGVGDVE